jgi:hypothetical protein
MAGGEGGRRGGDADAAKQCLTATPLVWKRADQQELEGQWTSARRQYADFFRYSCSHLRRDVAAVDSDWIAAIHTTFGGLFRVVRAYHLTGGESAPVTAEAHTVSSG